MFVPSMKDLQVPTIDKASYLSSKSGAPSFNQNATVAQSDVEQKVEQKVLFNSGAGSSNLFGSNSNVKFQQRPMMKKKMMKSKRPQIQQQQQIPLFQQQPQQIQQNQDD